MMQDLRYSVRRLLHTPLFSGIVVLTLALGIGANTAIFSVVNAVLLKQLPYREPERLVTVEHFYPGLNNLQAPVSAPGFRDYRDRTNLFESAAVETGWGPALTGMGDPQRLDGARVSGLFFRTLGIAPLRGRALLPEEDEPGRNKVVVLSYGLWQRLFGGEPSAVGKKMLLNGESYDIVGVMPAGFRGFFTRGAELWTPLALPATQFVDAGRTNEWLNFTGRLKPGVTLETAASQLREFAAQLVRTYPDNYPANWSLVVTSLNEKATGKIRPALLVLLGAVGFVLLIACANVANLLLARAAARLKEMAIRSALGASRSRIARQLLTESVILALAGGVLGLVLAYLGVRALVAFNPTNLPRADEIRVDGLVMAFTLGISLVTGLLFGVVPALQTSKTNLQETLKEGGRSSSADRGGHAVRRVLVVSEVALALTLLIGAGLLLKSFARLQRVETGFDPGGLLTFNVQLPAAKYPSDTAQIAFFDQVLPRLAGVAGVQSVGASSTMPFSGGWSTGTFTVEGLQLAPNQPNPWGDIRTVSPDFFETLRVPLKQGRLFAEGDHTGAPRVVVVDEEMVKRYWPNATPIGKRITRNNNPDGSPRWLEVVGVVGHTKQEGLDAESRVQLYFPYAQRGTPFLTVAVRTTPGADPLRALPAVREVVRSVDRDIPLSQVRTMSAMVEASVGERRLSMILLGVFATIALVLASIGIYGVMSYSVTQRSRELGVRMALGAERRSVLGLVMRQGMTLALSGVVLGVLGALALTRLIRNQLYSVGATDPATFVAVALLLAGIALVATFIPALRATRVDPVVALRQE
ncbi:MAG: ABC transporter permease [Gemmatimonadaceae bacterium]